LEIEMKPALAGFGRRHCLAPWVNGQGGVPLKESSLEEDNFLTAWPQQKREHV
jgi:hypothetical protein